MKAHDRAWVLARHESEQGLSLVRLMKLEASFPFKRYPERLNIIWPFRKTGVNGCDDVQSFLAMLSEIPLEKAPYPIEIHHETDRTGKFYKSYAKNLA